VIEQPVSVESLCNDFGNLGIGQGSRVLVHSSFRSVGPVERGPDGLVDALLTAIGPSGMLVVPTFTYRSERFDPRTTPGRTGAVSEAVRLRSDTHRSLHPFYSVAAIGPEASVLCVGHELQPGTGIDTPLDRHAAHGGLIVLIGVGHEANTTIHVGEFHAAVSYLDIPFDPTWPTTAEVVAPTGNMMCSYDRFPGCSRAFSVLEAPLRARGAVRDGTVGAAAAQVVPARAVIDEAVALLADNETALLCSDPDCFRCPRARARIAC